MCSDVLECLGHLQSDPFLHAQCFEGIMKLQHFHVVLEAAIGRLPDRPENLGKAMKAFEGADFTMLRDSVHRTKFGKEVIASASLVLQEAAKVGVALDKVKRATEILQDDRLPRFV